MYARCAHTVQRHWLLVTVAFPLLCGSDVSVNSLTSHVYSSRARDTDRDTPHESAAVYMQACCMESTATHSTLLDANGRTVLIQLLNRVDVYTV